MRWRDFRRLSATSLGMLFVLATASRSFAGDPAAAFENSEQIPGELFDRLLLSRLEVLNRQSGIQFAGGPFEVKDFDIHDIREASGRPVRFYAAGPRVPGALRHTGWGQTVLSRCSATEDGGSDIPVECVGLDAFARASLNRPDADAIRKLVSAALREEAKPTLLTTALGEFSGRTALRYVVTGVLAGDPDHVIVSVAILPERPEENLLTHELPPWRPRTAVDTGQDTCAAFASLRGRNRILLSSSATSSTKPYASSLSLPAGLGAWKVPCPVFVGKGVFGDPVGVASLSNRVAAPPPSPDSTHVAYLSSSWMGCLLDVVALRDLLPTRAFSLVKSGPTWTIAGSVCVYGTPGTITIPWYLPFKEKATAKDLETTARIVPSALSLPRGNDGPIGLFFRMRYSLPRISRIVSTHTGIACIGQPGSGAHCRKEEHFSIRFACRDGQWFLEDYGTFGMVSDRFF